MLPLARNSTSRSERKAIALSHSTENAPNKDAARPLPITVQKAIGRSFDELGNEYMQLIPKFRVTHKQVSVAIRNYYRNGWFREVR